MCGADVQPGAVGGDDWGVGMTELKVGDRVAVVAGFTNNFGTIFKMRQKGVVLAVAPDSLYSIQARICLGKNRAVEAWFKTGQLVGCGGVK